MTVFAIAACVALAAFCAVLWQRQVTLRREAYIRSFVLPQGLFERLRRHHPQLTAKDCQLVAQGLRQFFLAHLKSGRRFVSMPSQVVDDLWHELILYTRHYQVFCQRAFGRFLHHTPAVVLGGNRNDNTGIRRCWRLACVEENINPRKPSRLPLLFALDQKLDISNGFRYLPDCEAARRAGRDGGGSVHCGGDFTSPSFDGSTDGLDGDSGGSADGAGDGGADGGGDGGGGCGGGGD